MALKIERGDDGKLAASGIEINLTVAEQRRIVEHSCGEPCFRMWLTRAEVDRVNGLVDWTFHDLRDGRVGAWRRESDLAALEGSESAASRRVGHEIRARRIDDGVI